MGRVESRVVVVWEVALNLGYPLEVWECYNLSSSVRCPGCLFLTLLYALFFHGDAVESLVLSEKSHIKILYTVSVV